METQPTDVQSVPIHNTQEQASWDRPRTTDELLGFIARRETELDGAFDVE